MTQQLTAWLEEGMRHYSSGDPARALESWYRILEVEPQHAAALQYVQFVRQAFRLDAAPAPGGAPTTPPAPTPVSTAAPPTVKVEVVRPAPAAPAAEVTAPPTTSSTSTSTLTTTPPATTTTPPSTSATAPPTVKVEIVRPAASAPESTSTSTSTSTAPEPAALPRTKTAPAVRGHGSDEQDVMPAPVGLHGSAWSDIVDPEGVSTVTLAPAPEAPPAREAPPVPPAAPVAGNLRLRSFL